jgi:hypothetical protein
LQSISSEEPFGFVVRREPHAPPRYEPWRDVVFLHDQNQYVICISYVDVCPYSTRLQKIFFGYTEILIGTDHFVLIVPSLQAQYIFLTALQTNAAMQKTDMRFAKH